MANTIEENNGQSAAQEPDAGEPKKTVQRTRRTTRKTTKAATTSVHEKAEVAHFVAESLAELKLVKEKGEESGSKVTRRKPASQSHIASVVFSAGDETHSNEEDFPSVTPTVSPMTALLFQEPDVNRAVRSRRSRKLEEQEDRVDEQEPLRDSQDGESEDVARKRRRGSRGGRKNNSEEKNGETLASSTEEEPSRQASDESEDNNIDKENQVKTRRTRSRTRSAVVEEEEGQEDSGQSKDEPQDSEAETTVRRRRRRRTEEANDEVAALKGSTRLEAKRQRRKEGREAGRRRQTITESEFLARRESVDRDMLIREQNGLNQIAVIEDGVLVEHYVARHTQTSMVGNVYLGRVQNVLPSMEAAFVDIGKGRNAVLYAGEVNWEAAGMEGKPRKIEQALKSGDTVVVQVTKDPIGHKGARLTAQITLAGRHLVLVPSGAMTGISRKLPEKERNRLKKILKEVVPGEHGVIVRTAAEGASEEQLRGDVERLTKAWSDIQAKSKSSKNAPALLKGEPELAVRVVRDIFNEDFRSLKVDGDNAWQTIHDYVSQLSPELVDRLERWEGKDDIFAANRVDEQLAKAFDRKVFLPSGGSLVIDRTEAMTVIDVNTGKFTGSGGTLEETVTCNNLEAAEEIVRQLRLRDIGGIIVVDFIDMVLEANRDLVLRRLIECLGRDRTRHQVAEVTSLGLVQMTRKRVGQGLVEAFSTTCECCEGRGYITHEQPVEKSEGDKPHQQNQSHQSKAAAKKDKAETEPDPKHEEVKAALANIAAAAAHKHEDGSAKKHDDAGAKGESQPVEADPADPKEVSGEETKAKNAKTKEAKAKRGQSGKKQSQKSHKRSRPSRDDVFEEERTVADEHSEAGNAPTFVSAQSMDAQSVKTQGEQIAKTGRRRVSSSGTITPTTASSSAIMSFPVKNK